MRKEKSFYLGRLQMTLKLIDTFSGIGGFSLAAEQIVGGFETVAFVECEPYAQKILKKHWPNVPIYDDIRTYRPEPYSADVICAGFPCQDISVAGEGKGIKTETRSGLFYELINLIRLVRPRFIVLENVAAILNNGLDTVLAELYKTGLYECEWATFPASIAANACHQRDRWWLVAYPIGFNDRSKSKIQAGGNSFTRSIASNSQYDGSSPTKKSRSIEETNGRSEKRQNQTGKLERSSQPRDSEAFQLDVADSKSIGMEGSRTSGQQVKSEMERAGLPKWRFKRDLLSPDWRSYSSQPVLRRGDDGLSHRVDRLRCLGNTVVVPCAAIPLQRVKDLAES